MRMRRNWRRRRRALPTPRRSAPSPLRTRRASLSDWRYPSASRLVTRRVRFAERVSFRAIHHRPNDSEPRDSGGAFGAVPGRVRDVIGDLECRHDCCASRMALGAANLTLPIDQIPRASPGAGMVQDRIPERHLTSRHEAAAAAGRGKGHLSRRTWFGSGWRPDSGPRRCARRSRARVPTSILTTRLYGTERVDPTEIGRRSAVLRLT